jgi:hypothetical protein
VVTNGGLARALWPMSSLPPHGWHDLGFFADRAACQRYIGELGRPAVAGAHFLPGADLPPGVLVELDETARQARIRAVQSLAGSAGRTAHSLDPLRSPDPGMVAQLPPSVLVAVVQPAGGEPALIVLGFTETGLNLAAQLAHYPQNGPVRAGADLPLRAVTESRIYVLDNDLRPVPTGREGGLYVGGPALALGYAGDAALSALRFLPDPLGGPGHLMFATQLPARKTPDGTLRLTT